MAIFLIAVLSILSYSTATKAILKGEYKPNIYSRIIWFLLSINGLVGLLRLDSTSDLIALSTMQTIGSFIILIGALRYSIFKFGSTEFIASCLLGLSLAFWILGDYPVINVAISLIAHFIGGIPTIRSVYKHPHTENMMFWGYFAIASFISLILANKSIIEAYMFPLYFMAYNSGMVILSSRQYFTRHKKSENS